MPIYLVCVDLILQGWFPVFTEENWTLYLIYFLFPRLDLKSKLYKVITNNN